MKGFNVTNLQHMVEELGEDRTKSILLDFCCSINDDVEYFIRHKAIEFSKQELSKTHLVFTSYKDEPVLIGSTSGKLLCRQVQ